MKLLKNPLFAILICLLLIVSSTCISSVVGLNREYNRVSGALCEALVDFATREKLGELEQHARAVRTDPGADKDDFDALIAEYNAVASNYSKYKTAAVEKAIEKYSGYFKTLNTFPAKLFVRFLDH